MIACLKQQYRKNKRLSRLCENEIVRIMREAAQDYNLDPQLTQACSGEVCVFLSIYELINIYFTYLKFI